jgi:F420-dependent oxidoreductase-like protein
MRIGLQIPDFTWPGGPAELGKKLGRIAKTAEESGFDLVSVMDHLFQIPQIGPVENDMLEAYTTLGFLAAHTERVTLLTVVSAAAYRHPGVLAKITTTLDVLSGGRTMLGLGAGWNEDEARGLGIPFPSLRERFEQLEDALQVCLRMWSDDDSPFQCRHVRLERPMNSPQPLSRPHPPIMVGGEGEKKTLRLVARYAQACNMFVTPEFSHKLDVLRAHCETEGTDYDAIEKTANYHFDLTKSADETLAELKHLAELGVQTAICGVPEFWTLSPLEFVGSEIIPVASGF